MARRSEHPSNGLIRQALDSSRPTLIKPKALPVLWTGLQQVTFTIDGKTISGNHYKKPRFGGGMYVVKEAKNFVELVQCIAQDAVFRAKYQIPEYCRLDVSLCSSLQDRDNAVKVLNDAMQRIIYSADSRILDGATRKIKDSDGERTIVTATQVLGKWYNYPNVRKGNQIFSHEEWVANMLAPYLHNVSIEKEAA